MYRVGYGILSLKVVNYTIISYKPWISRKSVKGLFFFLLGLVLGSNRELYPELFDSLYPDPE